MWKLFVSAFILWLPQVMAQDASTPSPEDPNVFLIFLDFHEHLLQETVRLRTSGDARGAKNLESAWHARVHLASTAGPTISTAYHTLTASLAGQQAEAKAYVDRVLANRERPDLATMKAFEARRIAAILQAQASLKAALPPQDSQTLFSFIDNEFRSSVHKGALK